MRYAATAIFALFATAAHGQMLSSDMRDQTIESVAALIEENYVYADKAAEWSGAVRTLKDDSAFAAIDDARDFASALEGVLKNYDGHFSVTWSSEDDQDVAPSVTLPQIGPFEYDQQRNFGFIETRRLPGNVGYLNLTMFAPIDASDPDDPVKEVADASLTLLSSADAVIIDLRQNGGGSPAMVGYLISHLFDGPPFVFNTFYERQGDRTIELTTVDVPQEQRMAETPIFILTSARTGSAAEGFPYHMQAFERATIVGERTAGGANPGRRFDAGNGFSVFISTGAAINPITQTNWEGVGVVPDIEAPAATALDVAHERAIHAILERELPDAHTLETQWYRDLLAAKAGPAAVTRRARRDYVGVFGAYETRVEDDALAYQRGRRATRTLVPLGDDEFAQDGDGAVRIRFERDAQGEVVRMLLMTADGRVRGYARQEDAR